MLSNDNFGQNPKVMTAIIVDQVKYENSKEIYDDFTTSNYRLFFNDCSTLIYEISDSFGLYVPPRIICPYPEDSIKYLATLNEK